MVLTARHLWLAVALLAASCNQSLFDSRGENKDGEEVDPTSSCPAPCEGDAAADWNRAQGGKNGRWHYFDDQRTRSWREMTPGSAGGLTGLVGVGDPAAAIASCSDNQNAAACADRGNALLLMPSGLQATQPDPALAFVVEQTGTYRLTGSFAATAVAGEHQLWFYRNTRDDLLEREVVSTVSSDANGFDIELDALAGDRILVAVGLREAGAPVPMAMQLFVSRAANPSRCQMALRFEGRSGGLWDTECASFGYQSRRFNTELNDYAVLLDPQSTPSVIPELGSAMQFAEGDYLFPGANIATPGGALDGSGDVTIQFWASFPAGFPSTTARFYADVNDPPLGLATSGSDIGVTSAGNLDVFVAHGLNDEGANTQIGQMLPDNGWHQIRIVRDKQAGQLILCRDGARVVQGSFPPDGTTTGAHAPYLGRSPRFPQSFFNGALDDVRVFTRALPCL